MNDDRGNGVEDDNEVHIMSRYIKRALFIQCMKEYNFGMTRFSLIEKWYLLFRQDQ